MTIEVAFLVSCVSVAFSIFFGLKNNKRSDTKDIEERVKRDTKTDMKLDEITRNTVDIKNDISNVRNDLRKQEQELGIVKSEVDKAHSRIDAVMEILDMKRGGKHEESKEINQ